MIYKVGRTKENGINKSSKMIPRLLARYRKCFDDRVDSGSARLQDTFINRREHVIEVKLWILRRHVIEIKLENASRHNLLEYVVVHDSN